MTDASSSPVPPVTIHRSDYRPPEWQVPDIALDFALGLDTTRVGAALSVVRHADAPAPLTLRGDGLTPLAVRVDGESWNDWHMEGPDLIVDLGDRQFRVLHLPGHSPDSIALFDERDGLFFSGDAIYDDTLIDDLPDSNRAAYRRTMERLLDLPIRIGHGGHGPSFDRTRMREIAADYLRQAGI